GRRSPRVRSGPRRRPDAHAPLDAREHHGQEARGQITKFAVCGLRSAVFAVCSLPFAEYGLQFGVLSTAPLLETSFPDLTLHGRGKVRDIYQVGDALLLVATDRISAFDYVLGSGIPDKGKVLTQLSAFWFDATRHIVPNQVLETDARRYPAELRPFADVLAGRSMLVRKT